MKKLISSIFSLAIFSFFAFQSNLSAQTLDGPSNTGPGKVYECKGFFGGQKKLCMSENAYACSESDCF
ncbi:MAG: hypothetical protein ACQETL_15040 [Bacteroidota bacterium]